MYQPSANGHDVCFRPSRQPEDGNAAIAKRLCRLCQRALRAPGGLIGGIDIDDANYSLVNNIVNNNGGPGSVIGGMRIERTSARNEEFLFNTVAQNSRASGATTGSALRCELSNVVASSNIFMLEDTSSAALVTGCSTQYSLFDTADTMPVGTGNISAEAVFINPAARDFHLDPSSPGNDSAEPGTGVATDIDGNERPLQDAPDMGADQTP